MHFDTALQPFTPCLPIRGGKLQTSKHFSSSNPQLPYICSSLSTYINHQHQHANSTNHSSINSSVVWREVCPNSLNLYASSISSLSSSPYKSRYSMGNKNEMRAASEERPATYKAQPPVDNNTRFCGNLKKMSSNYDNHSASNSPSVARKSSQNKFWGKSQSPTPQQAKQKQFNTIAASSRETSPFLYDRRLNKSFETANGLLDENRRCQNEKGTKNSIFRRSSTPQLHSIYCDGNARDSVTSSWCCGNFVVKQWKKMNQHY